MGTTGLIFGAIVVAWLAYLLPMFLRRDSAQHESATDPESRFSSGVQILQRGSAQAFGADESDAVSTPLTRRAAAEEIRREERRAASRRRTVLLVLTVALVLAVILGVTGIAAWWAFLIPAGLLVGFLGIARVSVRAMHREFDRRLTAIHETGDHEDTVMIGLDEPAPTVEKRKPEVSATSVELGAPVGRPGTLWDPLPITRPTYVSAPIGRTVRTIDLSAPEPDADNAPVVADAPEPSLVDAVPSEGPAASASSTPNLRRAVGQ